MNSGADNCSTTLQRCERARDERADGRKDERGVQRLGRCLVAAAGPDRAQAPCERLPYDVARSRESKYFSSLGERDLRDQMPRRTESIDAEPKRIACQPIRAVTDQAHAQQRRRFDVGVTRRQRKAISRVGDDVFGVTGVKPISRIARFATEVLPAGRTKYAMFATRAEPRHADAGAYAVLGDARTASNDCSDNLMSGNHREFGVAKLSVDEMQIGPAHPAGVNRDKHLSGLRHGNGQSRSAQRLTDRIEQHRVHRRGTRHFVWRAPMRTV